MINIFIELWLEKWWNASSKIMKLLLTWQDRVSKTETLDGNVLKWEISHASRFPVFYLIDLPPKFHTPLALAFHEFRSHLAVSDGCRRLSLGANHLLRLYLASFLFLFLLFSSQIDSSLSPNKLSQDRLSAHDRISPSTVYILRTLRFGYYNPHCCGTRGFDW